MTHASNGSHCWFSCGRYGMKPGIHPEYEEITVSCSCGNKFTTRSTIKKDIVVEVCPKCHPFYTGQQKLVNAGGRLDRFRRRYQT